MRFSTLIDGRNLTVYLWRQVAPVLPPHLSQGSLAFKGRQSDMEYLLDGLAPGPPAGAPQKTSGGAARIVTVAGAPGVGKTELAIQVAYAALDKGWFSGGWLYIGMFGYDPDPDRKRKPENALAELLRSLGLSGENIPADGLERARLYSEVLARHAEEDEPVLIIIDDIADPGQLGHLIPEGQAGAIVTSRNTQNLNIPGARLRDVSFLSRTDSVALLEALLQEANPDDDRVSGDRDAAERLAGICDGLPLALKITAALLKEDPHRSLAALASDLSNERTRLDQLSYADAAVRAAFEVSYKCLDPGPARMFRLLAINPGPQISTEAAAALSGADQPAARSELQALARAHLISRVEYDSAELSIQPPLELWRMLDLLRLYATDESGKPEAAADGREQARNRVLTYYLDTAGAAKTWLDSPRDKAPSAAFESRKAALNRLDAERPSLVAAVRTAKEHGRKRIAIDLSLALGSYLYERRRFDEWLTILGISREIAAGDWSAEGAVLNDLGWALKEARRYDDAITVCEKARDIFQMHGDQHSEGGALTNLGLALMQVGREQEADTALGEAAAIFGKTGDRHGQAIAMTNRGRALEALDQLPEAIRAHEQAAHIAEAAKDPREQAGALTNLGAALRTAGQLDDAISSLRHAADIYDEIGNRHAQGVSLGQLGLTLQDAGRYQEAIEAHEENLRICVETGDDHGQAEVFRNLGLAQMAAGQLDKAAQSFQSAARIFEEMHDQDGARSALDNLDRVRANDL